MLSQQAAPVRNTVAADGAGTGAAGAPSDPAAVIDAAPICEASNPFCSMSPVVSMSTSVIPTETTCGATPLDLTPAGVNIMLAVDGSAAMAKHWSDIATAIRSLREANPTAAFGLHVFGATRFRWRTLTKR